jgi:hypothetical protein
MDYKGVWNASTNTPTLANGTGSAGDVYRVSVGGSRNLGSGSITFDVADYAIYNGTVWEKSDTTDAVASVNGYTGVVALAKSDVGLGNVDNTSDATKNSQTATLTNKTLSGASNTVTNLPASATPDAGRLVHTTAAGGSSAANGANTWTKIATISTGSAQYVDCNLLLAFTTSNIGSTQPLSAIISVIACASATGTNPVLGIEMVTKASTSNAIVDDSFKLVSGGWSSDIELWMRKGTANCKFSAYELSRSIHGAVTVTYNSSPAWQASEPVGAAVNVSSAGVRVGGAPVVTTTGTQTLTGKTLDSPAATGTTRVAQSGVIELYNTADQTTNFEKASFLWSSNQLEIRAGVATGQTGGTGTARALVLRNHGSIFMGISATAQGSVQLSGGSSSANITGIGMLGTHGNSSGINNHVGIIPTINQSGTAGYTALLINPTETATGSGTKRLIDAQVGGVSRFSVDNTGLALANNHASAKTSTVTSAGTTTLTIASAQVQEFTGTNAHTVRLPSTGVIAGQTYTIINNSTGSVTIQASDGTTLPITVNTAKFAVVVATVDTPTTNSGWQYVSLSATTTPSANPNTIAVRDNGANLQAVRFIPSLQSIATSGGTTAVSWNFSEILVFTGTSNHTVTLPSTSAIAGSRWTIINNSTGALTVNASGGENVTTLAAGATREFIALQATPTTAAHWKAI